MTGNLLFDLILAACVLIAAWWLAERFSPDPLLTKLVQVALFLAAAWIVFKKLLPLVGI